jgi:GNAT superfamily N-acetyltransferase
VAVEIRRVRPGEEARLRELRLRALADAPSAFAATVELEAAHPESHWAELVRSAVFIAAGGEAWVGMAAGGWFDREHAVAQLWGMWVDPARRGTGLGARLVSAVERWAAQSGARTLRLGVIDGLAVEEFYVRLGFTRTGETRSLSRDYTKTAVFLTRPVSSA